MRAAIPAPTMQIGVTAGATVLGAFIGDMPKWPENCCRGVGLSRCYCLVHSLKVRARQELV